MQSPTRLRRRLLALAVASALVAGAPALRAQQAEPATGDAATPNWRFVDGPGAQGVLRLADAPGAGARGFFVISIEGRGVFEGVYNIKEDGRAAVGMFWPEGRLNQGSVAGFLDLDADGAGGVAFTDGGGLEGLTAR